MWITSYGSTDVGQVRKNNEDAFQIDDELGLYVVCDGVGGHSDGEVASAEATARLVEFFGDHKEDIRAFVDTPAGRDAIRRLVRDAVQAANRRVWELASGEKGRGRMGTTMTMMIVVGDKAVMGHVGDSRLYIFRGGETHQLSEDHTYLNELLKRGEITQEETRNHPFSNVVTRVLGQHELVQVDTLVFDVLPSDTYLLCSDGLSGYIPDRREIGKHLKADTVDGIPASLIKVSNERGGKDNITAVVVRAALNEHDVELEIDRTDEITLQFNTLRFVSVFKYLTHKELIQVQHVSEFRNLKAGELVLREGETGASFFVILEGSLEVRRAGKKVTTLEAGTHFGEMALLNARPRSASVIAAEPARLLVMDRSHFNDLVRSELTLGVKLLWSFAQVLSLRLDETTEAAFGRVLANADAIAPPFATPADRM